MKFKILNCEIINRRKIFRCCLQVLMMVIGCEFVSYGQTRELDSLKTNIKSIPADSNKVISLNILSWKLMSIWKLDSAFLAANEAFDLANKLKFKKGMATAYSNRGNVFLIKNNYPEALKNHIHALELRIEIGDEVGISSSYNNIGNTYYNEGNFPLAIKNHFAALSSCEKRGDKQNIAKSNVNIGNIFFGEKNLSDALKHYKDALKIMEEIGNMQGIGSTRNNIGLVYFQQGKYSDALVNHRAALKIRSEIGDQQGIASSRINIGIIYNEKKNYQEALENFKFALRISEDIGDNKGVADASNNIGNIFVQRHKGQEGLRWLEKSMSLNKEMGNADGILESYNSLSQADSAIAASSEVSAKTRAAYWKSSIENYRMYIVFRDSLSNADNTKKSVQQQMQYEFDKKEVVSKAEQEKKDAISKSEARKQTIILYFVSCFGVLVLGLAVIIFRSLRINQKKNKIIQFQKEAVEHQKTVVELKQKEILDSITYARRIQQSLLPREEYLFKQIRRLREGDRT